MRCNATMKSKIITLVVVASLSMGNAALKTFWASCSGLSLKRIKTKKLKISEIQNQVLSSSKETLN